MVDSVAGEVEIGINVPEGLQENDENVLKLTDGKGLHNLVTLPKIH